MRDFRKLKVWERSHEFVLLVYRIPLPPDERFGLQSQLRRAAASVPTNIVEGCGRKSDREFARFLEIAVSSAHEVDYLLTLCRDLEYIDDKKHKGLEQKIVEIKKMLVAFGRTLEPRKP